MTIQTKLTNKDAQDFLAPDDDRQMSPEHEAWIFAEIEARMARREAGITKYTSLDDVMRKFGFDAR